jgi:hypothetical protein
MMSWGAEEGGREPAGLADPWLGPAVPSPGPGMDTEGRCGRLAVSFGIAAGVGRPAAGRFEPGSVHHER